MALQLRRGHTSSLGKTIATSFAVLALIVQPFAAVTIQKASAASGGDPCVAANTVTTQLQLEDAVKSTSTLTDVCLGNSIVAGKQITVAKSVHIHGQGHTLRGAFPKTGNDNNATVGISAGLGNTVTLSNIIIDGAGGTDTHGVNAYVSTAVLNNATISNHQNAAINVNGSAVTINSLTTLNNATKKSWGFYTYNVIELSKGTGVTNNPSLLVQGRSSHNETKGTFDLHRNHIQVKAGSVTDNGQYAVNGINYRLKSAPTAPVITAPTAGATVTTSSVNAEWSPVAGTTTTQTAVSYDWQLDEGTVYSDGATQALLQGITNGSHTLKVRAVSASGLASAWSVVTFTANVNQAPTLTVATPGEGSSVATKKNSNTLRITGTFTDDVKANYAHLQLVYRGTSKASGIIYGYGSVFNPTATYANANGDYTYDLAVPATLEDGEYSLFYIGTDFAGGATNRMERKFTIDNTAPAFEIVTPSNGSLVSGTRRVSAKITDASDITKVLMNVGDGKGNYVWEQGKTNNKVTRDGDTFYLDVDTKTLPEGVNYVVLRATDGAGNTRYYNNNAATRQYSYIVDNTAPIVTVGDITAITVGDKATVTGTVDDPAVTEVEIVVDSEPAVVVPVVEGAFSYDVEGLTVGTHSVSVQAKDPAGNPSQAVAKTVTVSARPPVVTPGGSQNNNTGNDGEVPTTEGDDDPDTDGDAGTQVFTAPIVALGNQAVLGSQDAAANQNQSNQATSDVAEQDVQGASDEKQNGMLSPLGFAWYWWLLALAAIAGLWWLLAALRRRKGEE